MFFYTKGMITKKRESFVSIYGENDKEFKEKLYSIYQHDRQLDKLRSKKSHPKVDERIPTLF